MFCVLKTTSLQILKSFNEQIKDNLKVKSLENQLSEINKKIANIMLAIESGIITPTTKEKLMTYESEKFDLDEKLSTAKNKVIQPITENDVKQFINSFASLDYTKTDNRKRLLEMFVNSVYLHENYAYVAYNGINKPRELYFANKKSYSNKKFECDLNGAPREIRTPDLWFRSFN